MLGGDDWGAMRLPNRMDLAIGESDLGGRTALRTRMSYPGTRESLSMLARRSYYAVGGAYMSL